MGSLSDAAVRVFLTEAGWGRAERRALAGDASERRFFRLIRGSGGTAVLMASSQDIAPFLNVAKHLGSMGLSSPNILASDRGSGLVLMEDLGDGLFAQVAGSGGERILYETAIDVLIELDGAPAPDFAPVFRVEEMCRQTEPAYEWHASRMGLPDWKPPFEEFRAALERALSGNLLDGAALLLRDYHAENLIWLPARSGIQRVGILDFQDAMAGPRGYDLVSLLHDARRDVGPDIAQDMVARFATGTGVGKDQLDAALAVIGLQRNLRILGIFTRLAVRDGKTRYVDFIPRVWAHAMSCLEHPSLAHLTAIIKHDFPPPGTAEMKLLRAACPAA